MARTAITCCYKCENRHHRCHGSCERYLKQQEELSATRKKEKENRTKSDAYVTGPKKSGPRKLEKI